MPRRLRPLLLLLATVIVAGAGSPATAARADELTAINSADFRSGLAGIALLSGTATAGTMLRVDLSPLDPGCATDAATSATQAEAVGTAVPAPTGPFANTGATVTPALGPARWVALCAYAVDPVGTTLARLASRWFVLEHDDDPVPALPAGAADAPPIEASSTQGPLVDAPAVDTCRIGPVPRRPGGRVRISCPSVRAAIQISAGRGDRTRWIDARLHHGRALVTARRLRLSRRTPTRIRIWQDDRLIGEASLRLRR